MTKTPPAIRTAHFQAAAPSATAAALHAALAPHDTELAIFFCPNQATLGELAAALRPAFGRTPLIGCTSTGQIGSLGYACGSVSGASFASGHFAAASHCITDLEHFDLHACPVIVQDLLWQLERRAPTTRADTLFAFLMIDGGAMREEWACHALQSALGRIPLVGGSVGGTPRTAQAGLYFDGEFRSNCAVLTLVSTALPFRAVMTEHFVTSDQRVVVTAADTARRVVHEIDGRPAAEAYAMQIGVKPSELTQAHFVSHPLAVVISGRNYVRSVGQMLPDGSLQFFCAIEEGVVLRVVRGTDMLANLERTLASLKADIGEPQLILGCECISRHMEARQKGLEAQLGSLLAQHHVCGFDTYGEQYLGVHVNHTFAGLAIGRRPELAHG